MKETEKRPRLKNLDDLFKLTDNMKEFQETPALPANDERGCATVSIDRLMPFPDHPFRLYEGERLADMVESIRANGVLIPIIAREKGDKLEILSGHNRVNAAMLAELKVIPAIILADVSDEDALVYVVETNLMQRSFADMCHSEKAAVISLQHSKLFSQGKRNDILAELEKLDNAYCSRDNTTYAQLAHKLKSRDIVAEQYSLSKDTVARYLRVFMLIPSLKMRLDNDEIAFIPAVTISFLQEPEQELLNNSLELNRFAIDMKKAAILRQYSEKGKLDSESIYLILSGELGQKPKPNRTPTVKITKTVYARYFKFNQPAKEVQEIVEKALELYFSHISPSSGGAEIGDE